MLRLQKQLLSLLRIGSASPVPISTTTSHHRRLSATAPTSTSPFSVEDYLVTTCGLTRAQALKASKKLSHHRSPSKIDAVLAFLSGLGLSRSDIAAIIAADPQFLCCKVEETLSPRIAALRGLGLSASEIARLVLVSASALRSCDIASRLEFWIPLFGSFDELIQGMTKGGSILKHDIEKVKPNIAQLLQCGLSIRDLTKIGLSGTWALICNLGKLKALLIRAEELGVPRGSGAFKYALATVTCISQEKLASRRELLKRTLGCSDEQLRIAVIRHPSLLRASEHNLRSKAEFLTTKAGLKPDYVVRRPALLSYSLMGRLVPRYLVMKTLQDKGLLKADYCSLLVTSEKYFVSRFIECYKESVPGLADVYAAARKGEIPPQLQS